MQALCMSMAAHHHPRIAAVFDIKIFAVIIIVVVVDIVDDNIVATVILAVDIVVDNPVDVGLDPLSLTPSSTAALLQYFKTLLQTTDGEDACSDS